MSTEVAGSVLIVGTGLIGSSVGLALARIGLVAWLEDADPRVVELAAGQGAGVPAPASADPELVVVAVPPAAIAASVLAALRRFPRAAVTDVGSVKSPILQAVLAESDASRYLGGHPMAGREVSGPLAGRGDLFDDRPWVLCPHPALAPSAERTVRGLVRAAHGIPIILDPAAHDRAVASVSHAPQLVSSLLAARLVAASEDTLAISGQGLRDMTRIAASDPGLWSQILAANSAEVGPILQALRADLDRALEALTTGDVERLREVVARGNQGRGRIPGKHGGLPMDALQVIPVKIADRPGELSRLFTAVEAAGVNVEDARIEHVLGRPTGVVQITVTPAAAYSLREQLRAQGWAIRG
ncbi:MAG: prephenate dehydrogenase [Candidatus Nanopelagicales bacterium]